MIDIKLIRENRDLVKENIKKKFQDEKLVLVDEVYDLDISVREAQTKADELKAKKMAENESKFANLSESVKRLIRKFNIVDLSFLEKDMKSTMTRLELESWIPELKYLFLKMGINKSEQNKAIKQLKKIYKENNQ